ncbi:MAG: TIM barrel protein [Candidatus Hodarchaeales archaeon]
MGQNPNDDAMDLSIGSSYALHGLLSHKQILAHIDGVHSNELSCIEFGLQRCSLNWTKGRPGAPYPSEKFARKTASHLEELGISASIHAPYSIVVTSSEPGKTQFAKATMTATTRVAGLIGATHITFHCGSRGMGRMGLERAKTVFMEMLEARNQRNQKIEYSPEVAGKVNSLGSFHEILELAECCGTLFTWDFAHDFARGASITSFKELLSRVDQIESRLDFSSKRRFPIHISGIVGGKGGERYHVPLGEGDGVPWELFLTVLKQTGFLNKCSIICESQKRDASSKWSRITDAKKIREFCLSNAAVTKWIPKKPALSSFLK